MIFSGLAAADDALRRDRVPGLPGVVRVGVAHPRAGARRAQRGQSLRGARTATQTTIVRRRRRLVPVMQLRDVRRAGADNSGGRSSGGTVAAASRSSAGGRRPVRHRAAPVDGPDALKAWLTANGYAIPAIDAIIAAYVTEGFDFLALRLPRAGRAGDAAGERDDGGRGAVAAAAHGGGGDGRHGGHHALGGRAGPLRADELPDFTIGPPSSLGFGTPTATTRPCGSRRRRGSRRWQIESSLDLSAVPSRTTFSPDSSGERRPRPARGARDRLHSGSGGSGSTDYVAIPAMDGGPEGGPRAWRDGRSGRVSRTWRRSSPEVLPRHASPDCAPDLSPAALGERPRAAGGVGPERPSPTRTR